MLSLKRRGLACNEPDRPPKIQRAAWTFETLLQRARASAPVPATGHSALPMRTSSRSLHTQVRHVSVQRLVTFIICDRSAEFTAPLPRLPAGTHRTCLGTTRSQPQPPAPPPPPPGFPSPLTPSMRQVHQHCDHSQQYTQTEGPTAARRNSNGVNSSRWNSSRDVAAHRIAHRKIHSLSQHQNWTRSSQATYLMLIAMVAKITQTNAQNGARKGTLKWPNSTHTGNHDI